MLYTEEMESDAVITPSTAFLNKLWKLVNDPNTNDLIKWTPKGTSFIITNQTRFSQELVPKYFKHNNMASFVRQLNMYGFRKVVSVESGGLSIDKGEMEFSHKQFLRGQPGLIENIKRKPQTPRALVNTESNQTMSNLLSDLKKVKMSQEEMETKWIGIKKENELLWREYANMRQKFSKQQQIIEKLVQFLLALVKSPGQTLTPKRKFNHLALECVTGDGSQPATSSFSQDPIDFESGNMLPISGPVIHEVTHLENDAQPLCLEKVTQNTPKTPLIAAKPLASNPPRSLPKPSINTIAGKMRNDISVNPVDKFINHTMVGNSGKRIGKQAAYSNNPVIFRGNNAPSSTIPNENVYVECDPNYLLETQACTDENEFLTNDNITVESPNGTVLDSGVSSIDQELESGLLQGVDPSAINPNITINVPNQPAEVNRIQPPSNSHFYPSFSHSSARKLRGKGIGKKAGGKFVPASRGKTAPIPTQTTTFPTAKKTVSKADTKLVPFVKLLENNDNSTSTQASLAIPDNVISKEEVTSHLDDVQTSLESLQEILNSGNFNVDTSTILSLFGDDNSSYLPDQDPFGQNSGVVGNEVSVYNPTLYDMADDDLFPSIFPESTPKRPRLELKRERKDSEIDDVLSTPYPLDPEEEPSFM